MLVTVNRVVIPDEDITEESAHVDVRGVEERRQEATRQLVVRELLRQRAEAIGLDTESDPDAAIEHLMEDEVRIPEIDEESRRRYFEANAEQLTTPVHAELRHVLVAAPPDDPEARAEAEDRSKALIESLQQAPERFEALAAEHSACPSASSGGQLGVIGRGQTVPEFESVVLRLDVGLAERAVETRYGFHVVEVLHREGGEPLSYDQARERIGEYIQERSWRRAVSQYIGRLAADAELEGVDLGVDDSPLVQ